MPEWHCDPGVSIAGMTALPKCINLSLHQLNGGVSIPEWGVSFFRNGGSG